MLAPFSDIDLLFLTRDEPGPARLATVEFMLYFLWDLGLKVGHATRSVDECLAEAERDMTVRTSLIDARLLTGDAALFDAFQARFVASCHDRAPAPSSPPSRRSATPATTATARAPSWSSPTSRRAAAACATCRPCTG